MATPSQRPLIQSGLTPHDPTSAIRKQSPLAQLCDVLDRLRSLSLSVVQDVAREDLSTFFLGNHNQPQALIQHEEALENARLSLIRLESNQVAPAELVRMHNQDIVPLLDSLLSEDERASVKPANGAPLTMRMAHLARLKLIGYAIANNFAGMDESTSRDVTYKFFRGVLSPIIEGHSINLQLRRDISQLSLLRPVAETLFRGAIENSDATAVSHVLSWPGVEIDVDSTVCTLRDNKLTPVEAAASLGDFRTVQLLLQHNADPNRICRPIHENPFDSNRCRCSMKSGGALYHACKGQGPTLELARLIVQCGGTICSLDVKEAVRQRCTSIIIVLLDSTVPWGCKSRMQAGVIHDAVLRLDEEEQNEVLRAGQAAGLNLETNYPEYSCPERVLDGGRIPCRIIDIAAQRGQLATVHLLHGWQHSFTEHTLVAGIRSRNAALVDYLLAGDAPKLCFSDEYSTTPYAEAVRLKNLNVVSIFQKSHSINQLIHNENSLCATLASAAEAGAESLVDSTMALRIRVHPNILGYALTRACESGSLSIAKKLLESGASVARGQYTAVMGHAFGSGLGSPCPCPLTSAISNRNVEMIELLLEHDVGESEHNDTLRQERITSRENGFHAAVAGLSVSAVVLLLKSGFDLDIHELLLEAVKASNSDTVQLLLSDPYTDGTRAISDCLGEFGSRLGIYGRAIICQDDSMIRLLLEHDTALYLAFDPGAFTLALRIAPRIYQALVEKVLSCDPSSHCAKSSWHFEKGWMAAIRRKRPEMLHWMASNLIILRGIDEDCFFGTADCLDLAIKYGKEGPLSFLLNCGLNVDAPLLDDRGFHSPQQQLRRFNDGSRCPSYTILLKYIKSQDLQAIRTLLDIGASINLPAKYGIKRTPLQQAAEIGSLSIIEHLLSRGADIHAPTATRGGGTPAQLAAIGGFIGVVQYLERHGDDIWAHGCTVNGRTALEGAAEHGRYGMVHWLASRSPPDLTQYEKAADFARDNGHSAIAIMLESMYQARIAGMDPVAEITPIVEMTSVAPQLTQSECNTRRHICKTCSAAFGRATTLRRHERSHKETYPYRCQDCDQGFRRKDTLDRHIDTHTGGTHQCHVCGSEHSRRDVLLKHMRDEHSDSQL